MSLKLTELSIILLIPGLQECDQRWLWYPFENSTIPLAKAWDPKQPSEWRIAINKILEVVLLRLMLMTWEGDLAIPWPCRHRIWLWSYTWPMAQKIIPTMVDRSTKDNVERVELKKEQEMRSRLDFICRGQIACPYLLLNCRYPIMNKVFPVRGMTIDLCEWYRWVRPHENWHISQF